MKFQLVFLVFLLFALAFATKVMEEEEFNFAEEEAEFDFAEEGETFWSCDTRSGSTGRTQYRFESSCKNDCRGGGKRCVAH